MSVSQTNHVFPSWYLKRTLTSEIDLDDQCYIFLLRGNEPQIVEESGISKKHFSKFRSVLRLRITNNSSLSGEMVGRSQQYYSIYARVEIATRCSVPVVQVWAGQGQWRARSKWRAQRRRRRGVNALMSVGPSSRLPGSPSPDAARRAATRRAEQHASKNQ